MRKQIFKAIGFLVVFIIALNIISQIMNKGNTDLTVEMSEASFPIVSMKVSGHSVNQLHGYCKEMEANYLRDTLTPLPENRCLQVDINTFGTAISTITYEVRSLDTTRLVESTPVYNYLSQDDHISAEFNIKDLIDDNTEYILVTILGTESGKEIRYYTRIVHKEDMHEGEQLQYVLDFHNKTFDKAASKELVTYLESNEEGDNSNFHKVNIHSSLNQITWGELNAVREGEPEVDILEMDSTTSSINLRYDVSIGTGKKKSYYNVQEYFRIRYTEDRIYLLEYERTMDQLFDYENDAFANDKIVLGITGEDVTYAENTEGSVVAFSQQNALYGFKNSDSKLARLFSFYDENQMDERTLYAEHDIKILSVDEAGNIRFLVYGYMNRGRHEGDVGVSVYYYDSNTNTVEEEVYLPYSKSYDLLKENLNLLSFINSRNNLYIYLDGTIYNISLEDNSYSVVADELTEDNVVVSESNQMVAWQESGNTQEIKLMDLSVGREKEVKVSGNNRNMPLGFVGEDFVYGVADKGDIVRDTSGIVTVPMHTIYIENKQGDILKTYHTDNIYITSVQIEDNVINMQRIQKQTENGYVQMNDDQIMNNHVEEENRNKITTAVTEDRESIVQLQLLANINTRSIKLLTPQEVLFEGGRNLELEKKEITTEKYYVYAHGDIEGIYQKPYEAVNKAASVAGVVVNDGQEYIWQKGNRAIRTQIKDIEGEQISEDKDSLAVCLDEILVYENSPRNSAYLLQQGETAISVLESNLSAYVLELAGCNLSDVLYYVSQGTPVIATVDNDKSVLIVGYDEKNTIIMNPETGTVSKKGMNDSTAWFQEHGNEFIAYVRKE